MNVTTTRGDQYGLVRISGYNLDDAMTEAAAICVKDLRRNFHNIILEVGDIGSTCQKAYELIVRLNRELGEEGGTLVLATRSDVLLDELEEFAEDEGITVVPTVEEAIDAVYFHEIERDLQSDRED